MNGTIMEFISSGGLARKDIDLLVDIKETQGNGDKYAKYFGLSQKMPHLLSWRTFIFASGSFPEDLSKCRIDEENLAAEVAVEDVANERFADRSRRLGCADDGDRFWFKERCQIVTLVVHDGDFGLWPSWVLQCNKE